MAEADLLYGIKEIAAHLNKTPKQVTHWIAKGLIPVFRMGGVVCSTKSGLAEYFSEQMRTCGRIGANPG
jgi:hypothetical protein